jgi:hypothetical protein
LKEYFQKLIEISYSMMIKAYSATNPADTKMEWNKEGLDKIGDKLFDEFFLDCVFGSELEISK